MTARGGGDAAWGGQEEAMNREEALRHDDELFRRYQEAVDRLSLGVGPAPREGAEGVAGLWGTTGDAAVSGVEAMSHPELPPPPGDADESRVASLRSSWATIGYGKPGMRSVQQELKPDVMYLLDLAEEALRYRRERGR